MKMKDLCRDDRPRERLLDKGSEVLSNAELLAILLRTGTGKCNVVELARELLSHAEGRLNVLAGMSIDRLCEIKGIGPDKAATVAAAFELVRRCASESVLTDRRPVASPRTVFRMMYPLLRGLDHEECWVIFLNRANYILGKEKMTIGGMDSTVIDAKVIIRRTMDKKASGIILVHNHPSGNALPGQADITQTDMLRRALKTCDLHLVDHVIVADESWYSFADEQLVNEKF